MDNEWAAGTAAFDALGFDPTGVRSGATGFGSTNSRRQGDPTGVDQWNYGFGGFDPLMDWGVNALNEQIAKDNAANQWNAPGQWTTGGSSQVGGEWGGVEQWSSDIQAASLKYGVPVNLIKAIMRVESNGDPNAPGAPGVWGPMQVNSAAWGQGPWSTDARANIDKGVSILKSNYDTYGNWDMAIQAYLGLVGEDMYGTDKNEYLSRVKGYWDQLNNASMGAGLSAGAGGGTGGGIGSIFPVGTIPEWGEFGVESDNGFYGYGTQYGMNGTQHTGVDVPMAVGTPYRAPMAGTITCAGTNNGPGADGNGCAAFGDTIGGGVGRVEMKLDNGVVLIFGHSNTSQFRVGDRVNAGQVIGTSGGMVSPHIHLEARVPDPSTPSGYRIVDPRTVLGGVGNNWASGGYTNATVQQPASSWQNAMVNFLTIPGYSWGQ